MKPSQIVIGTRGSKLAQAQARMVSDGLRARWADLAVETKIITTSGDENNRKIRDAVQSAGRKGLFTAEIERALLAGDVDLAVHSAKDLPSELTAGTEIAAVLPRAPVDDVLISI
ncbi:MAG: hydroxymethylbilane synthase, partial [Verrucomicrobia bacterium]